MVVNVDGCAGDQNAYGFFHRAVGPAHRVGDFGMLRVVGHFERHDFDVGDFLLVPFMRRGLDEYHGRFVVFVIMAVMFMIAMFVMVFTRFHFGIHR